MVTKLMKMKNLLYFVFFVTLLSCEDKEPTFFEREFLGTDEYGNSQNIRADVYSGIPASKRVAFFNETFDNNTNNWTLANTTQSNVKIENGNFVFQNKSSGALISTLSKAIDIQQNFEIEASIKISTTNNTNANSFVWGYKYTDEHLFFCYSITADQMLWLGYYQSKTYTPWQNWLQKNVNGTGMFNKLNIRKISNSYYVFINEQFINTYTFEQFYGDRIGFVAASNTTLIVDYVKIDYINN